MWATLPRLQCNIYVLVRINVNVRCVVAMSAYDLMHLHTHTPTGACSSAHIYDPGHYSRKFLRKKVSAMSMVSQPEVTMICLLVFMYGADIKDTANIILKLYYDWSSNIR